MVTMRVPVTAIRLALGLDNWNGYIESVDCYMARIRPRLLQWLHESAGDYNTARISVNYVPTLFIFFKYYNH